MMLMLLAHGPHSGEQGHPLWQFSTSRVKQGDSCTLHELLGDDEGDRVSLVGTTTQELPFCHLFCPGVVTSPKLWQLPPTLSSSPGCPGLHGALACLALSAP